MQCPARGDGVGDALRGQQVQGLPSVGGDLCGRVEQRAVKVKYDQIHFGFCFLAR